MKLLFNEYKVSVLEDEKIIEIYYTTLCLLLTKLYCILKSLMNVDLMLCVSSSLISKSEKNFRN